MNKKQIDIDKNNENKSIDKQKSKNIILKKDIKQTGKKILKPGTYKYYKYYRSLIKKTEYYK